jgi:uncharacterized protein DUF6886
MLPGDGEALHFSEDPSIEVFEPHVAATAVQRRPLVWAVDAEHAPCYWFPRNCPRVTAWITPATTDADALLLGGADRVHAIETRWLPVMRSTRLYAYRLPADQFDWIDPDDHYALVSPAPVRPLGPPEPLGDLVRAHESAGIELRLLDELRPFLDQVRGTTLAFSAIRLKQPPTR